MGSVHVTIIPSHAPVSAQVPQFYPICHCSRQKKIVSACRVRNEHGTLYRTKEKTKGNDLEFENIYKEAYEKFQATN